MPGTDADDSISGQSGRGATERDLYAFLCDAQLEHHYTSITHSLKVTAVAQLKYVTYDDLIDIGMTRPETRRLRKRYRCECPQSAVDWLRWRLVSARGEPRRRKLSPLRNSGDSAAAAATSTEEATEVLAAAAAAAAARGDGSCVIPGEQLELGRLLGEGDFARVHLAVWRPFGVRGKQLQVAAKVFARSRLAQGESDGVAAFLREAAAMSGIDHRSVARVFGVSVIMEDSLALVTELAPLRSLLECVREPALRSSFHPAGLCDVAQQVAEGMSYLENRRIVHRDLAARNILVFSQRRVKIGDTGISRALQLGARHYQANLSPSLKLPAAWCAPECLKRPDSATAAAPSAAAAFTSASDVWSYGVLLWEAFTYGFKPWAGLTGQQVLVAVDEPQLSRLSRPDACPAEHYALLLRCWSHRPADRPTFAEVAAHLPKILPERVIAKRGSGGGGCGGEFLHFAAGDVILVLDRGADVAGEGGGRFWRGIRLEGGGSGLFRPEFVSPERPTRPDYSSLPLPRRGSPEISQPGKFRHVCHVGIDGTVFGDEAAMVVARLAKDPVPRPQRITAVSAVASSTAKADEDEFQLDLGGSLVDEVLKTWSLSNTAYTASGDGCEGGDSKSGDSGTAGSSSGDGRIGSGIGGDDGGRIGNCRAVTRSQSLSSATSSDIDNVNTYVDVDEVKATRQRNVDSATSSVSSLAGDPEGPATTAASAAANTAAAGIDHRPLSERRRCSSALTIPSLAGRPPPPPPPPPTPMPTPTVARQSAAAARQSKEPPPPRRQEEDAYENENRNHLVQHMQQQQQQHAALRSLRASSTAFRAPLGSRPPPKPVRPLEPGRPWTPAFDVGLSTFRGGTARAGGGLNGSSGFQQLRTERHLEYASMTNNYVSSDSNGANEEYEEVVNL